CDYLVRFLIIARPPRPPLFPYTTLFRSMDGDVDLATAQRILEGRHERTIAELADRSRALVARGGYDDELRVITDARRDEASLRRSEEHTSELQSRSDLVCRLLLEKKKEI